MKILIVDDEQLKIDGIKDSLTSRFKNKKFHFEFAKTYDKAMLFINDKFDVIVCDQNLRNSSHSGITFLKEYQSKWPETFCLWYSVDAESLNENNNEKINCYSYEEIKTILVDLIVINETPKIVKSSEECMEVPNGGFNQRVCDAIHDSIKKDQENNMKNIEEFKKVIYDKVDEYKESVKEVLVELKGVRKDSRNMMFSVLLCALAFIGNMLLENKKQASQDEIKKPSHTIIDTTKKEYGLAKNG